MQERNGQLERFSRSEEWLSHYDDRVMALIGSDHVVDPASPRRGDGARGERAGWLRYATPP